MNHELYKIFKPYIESLENPNIGILKELNKRKNKCILQGKEAELSRVLEDLIVLDKFKGNITKWILDRSIDAPKIEDTINAILDLYKNPKHSDLNLITNLLSEIIKIGRTSDSKKNGLNIKAYIVESVFNFLYSTLLVSIFTAFLGLNIFLLKNINEGIKSNSVKLLEDKIVTDSLIVRMGKLFYDNEQLPTKLVKSKILTKASETSEINDKNVLEPLINLRSSSIPNYTFIIVLYFVIGLVILFTIYQLTLKVFQEIVKIKIQRNSRRNIEFILSLNDTSVTDVELRKFWDEAVKNYFEKPVNQESSLEYFIKKIRLTSK
jgi:hypothetical protein